MKDASVQDFVCTLKDSNKNVNIECSSGFYAQVAKPTVCALATGYIPPIQGYSTICDNHVKNIDLADNEYNLMFTFKIKGPTNGKVTKVTIHLHHSSGRWLFPGQTNLCIMVPEKCTL